MTGFLKDIAVALCALAYSAAILGLAVLIVLGTPGPKVAATAETTASEPVPVPAASNPLPPPHPRQGHTIFRDL